MLDYWLALSYLDGKGVGPATARLLLDRFGDPEAIFHRGAAELKEAGIRENAVAAIRGFRGWDEIKAARSALEMVDAGVLNIADAGYPESLKRVENPPVVLYVRGEIHPEDSLALAMVGTRKPTDYGLRTARALAEQLASCRICVVSGLARGIDAASHEGALKAEGGRSLAVLGCGIDQVYPPENASLARRIAESGAVIAEFFPGVPPKRENFPRRNRLIAGLSLGVLVVEAGVRSGTTITADFATKQGKPVFGVPGPIDSPMSQGVHRLLRDGAVPVFEAMDVLSEILPEYRRREDLAPPVLDVESWKSRLGLTGEAAHVVEALSIEPRHVDEMAGATGLPIQRLLTLLLELELRGIVEAKPGMHYVLKMEHS